MKKYRIILSFSVLFFSLWLISCGDNTNSSLNINPCENNPCASSPVPHKTVCKPVEGDVSVTPDDFTCVCEEGYIEENGACKKEEVNPCEPNPCTEEHKTICKASTDNNFTCSCEEGYIQNAEDKCELPAKCEADSCTEPHKTVCSIENNQISCSCDKGFEENQQGECKQLSDIHIRAVAGNISTTNNQNYDHGEGIKIFQGLKANVIMIQEFNYKNNSSADYREMVEAIFQDPGCLNVRCYYVAGSDENSHNIPNGIISRFPIIDSGYWPHSSLPDRDMDWAILDIPGNKDLFVVSVHLHTGGGSTQKEEAQVVAKKIAKIKEDYPDKYYYLVGGDFNGDSAVSDSGFGKYQGVRIFTTSTDNNARPVGEDGSYGTNAKRSKPYDWVLSSPDLTQLQVSSDFCNQNDTNDCKRYSHGLIMDTRDFTQNELDKYFSPTSFNGYSLETDDSQGNNMQHMAIIRDFVINFGE